MPAPLRLRAERNFVVRFGKGLQTGGIRCERKLAIAYGKTRARIERAHHRTVPPHQSRPVDFLRALQTGERSQLYEFVFREVTRY